MIEGELEFDLAGDLRIMGPGMAVVVPSGAPHGARTHDTSCFEIDIFHPPRRALLELTQASGEHLSWGRRAVHAPCRLKRRRAITGPRGRRPGMGW